MILLIIKLVLLIGSVILLIRKNYKRLFLIYAFVVALIIIVEKISDNPRMVYSGTNSELDMETYYSVEDYSEGIKSSKVIIDFLNSINKGKYIISLCNDVYYDDFYRLDSDGIYVTRENGHYSKIYYSGCKVKQEYILESVDDSMAVFRTEDQNCDIEMIVYFVNFALIKGGRSINILKLKNGQKVVSVIVGKDGLFDITLSQEVIERTTAIDNAISQPSENRIF